MSIRAAGGSRCATIATRGGGDGLADDWKRRTPETGTTATSFITAGAGSADIALGGAAVDLTISPMVGVYRPDAVRTFALFNFVPGADKVTLSGYVAGTADAGIASQVNSGGSTFVSLAHGSVVLDLVGVAQADARLFG